MFILGVNLESESLGDDESYQLMASSPIGPPMMTRLRAHTHEASNLYCPTIMFSFDNSWGVKVLQIYSTLPSSSNGESVHPTISKNGMEVTLTYTWEPHLFSVFERTAMKHGEQAYIALRESIKDLLTQHGDPVTGRKTTKLTLSLPFKCEQQFYLPPTHVGRGFEVILKSHSGNKMMCYLAMQLCAVRDNYTHYHAEPISQVFLDPLEQAEDTYVPPANPTPQPQGRNPTVPPTPHVARGNQNVAQATPEVVYVEPHQQVEQQTQVNNFAEVRPDMTMSQQGTVDTEGLQIALQKIALVNPDFANVLMRHTHTPVLNRTPKVEVARKHASDDDTTVEDVTPGVAGRVINGAISKMWGNMNK